MAVTAPTDAAPRANDPRLDAWRAFLTAHARVIRRLDEELRAEHDVSLAEYDALLQLAHAPDRRLRMSRLADRVLLSRSGVTRLIDRLEADGFVVRGQCLSDARGAEAVLTPAGLARLRAASDTHLAGIERYFLSLLSPDELSATEQVLGRIARTADQSTPPEAECAPAATEANTLAATEAHAPAATGTNAPAPLVPGG